MTQRTLMSAGIIAIRDGSARMVTIAPTYRHPTIPNLRVTLHPIPFLGSHMYWGNAWYGLHNRFDRIVMEDGQLPVRRGTAAAFRSRLLQLGFPIVAHAPIVDTDVEAGKYETAAPSRDRMETSLAYTNVAKELRPPVDPRARRAVDHLNTIATQMASDAQLATREHHVVMPWNVYHVYYLRWRLPAEGWTLEREEDINLVGRAQVAFVTLSAVFGLALVSAMILRWLVSFLFWW